METNFQLKNPRRYYIWSVKSVHNCTQIFLTDKLKPRDFWFQVGQFVNSPIVDMELIGYKYVKDHFGNDVEEVFKTTGKKMCPQILEDYNNCDVIRSKQ